MAALPRQLPPALWVFDPDLARCAGECAAALDREILLLCPQGSAGFGGPRWFWEMTAAAAAVTGASILRGVDAADDAGLAYEALRLDFDVVIFRGGQAQHMRLRDIAAARGAHLLSEPPDALNLAAAPDPARACHDWISQ